MPAHLRSEVRDAVNRHLQYEPRRVSRSRIKRLKGLSRPQYRLRAGTVRLFYDVSADEVQVLGVVEKYQVDDWRQRIGEQ